MYEQQYPYAGYQQTNGRPMQQMPQPFMPMMQRPEPAGMFYWIASACDVERWPVRAGEAVLLMEQDAEVGHLLTRDPSGKLNHDVIDMTRRKTPPPIDVSQLVTMEQLMRILNERIPKHMEVEDNGQPAV